LLLFLSYLIAVMEGSDQSRAVTATKLREKLTNQYKAETRQLEAALKASGHLFPRSALWITLPSALL
jgi:hypothetical protein